MKHLLEAQHFPCLEVNNEGKTLPHDKRELEKTMQKCLQIMRQGIQQKNSMNKCSLLMRKLREFNEKDAETLTRKEK